MKKFVKKIVAILIVALIASQFSFVYALEKEWKAEELSEDQQKAFITRDEFTDWVTGFTASLSEVDKIATQKIFDNMDFYDLQYKITIVYDFNENTGKWYSDIIERPEGKYSPKNAGGSTVEELKQQLEAFRDHAVAWEKHRRHMLNPDNPPSPHQSKTWQQFSDWQRDSATYTFIPTT